MKGLNRKHPKDLKQEMSLFLFFLGLYNAQNFIANLGSKVKVKSIYAENFWLKGNLNKLSRNMKCPYISIVEPSL